MKCNKRAAGVLKRWAKRNFTKEGLTNRQTFERKIEMESMKNVAEADVSAMSHVLQKDMVKAFGVKRYSQITDEQKLLVNAYIAGESVHLPAGLGQKINHLRAYVDRLSRGMMSALQDMMAIQYDKLSKSQKKKFDGFLAGTEDTMPASMVKHFELYQTINKNIGKYLTRSYAAFDDAKWKEKTLENKELIERAELFIAARNEDLTPAEVTGAVRAILQNAKDNGNFVAFVAKGSKQGGKDVSILTRRKTVPPVIMELLGVYEDPRVNFVKTATKMNWYLANHHFLMKVRTDGLGVFLFEKPTDIFDKKIATEGSETMNPLNGLYTTEDFDQGMKDAVDKFDGSELMRTVIRINSMVKYGKTILSPTTQARNFMSASMFSIANGHFNWTHAIKSFRAAKSDLFTKDEAWRAYINKLTGLGVLHDNPYAGELRDAIRDFTDADPRTFGPQKSFKNFLNFMQKVYQIGDDFWKIIGYENELSMQLRLGLTQSQAEKKAAYRIRNGYPTYSMVPRGVKKLRRWPLIGTFVSFPYEIVRTAYNQMGFIKDDVKAGNMEAAARRVLGFGIASAASYSASIYSMMLLGLDSEDDEAVRAQLPVWSRNSQLLYTGYDENGMLQYLDLSYIDPYTYLKTPITAIISGNNEGIDDKIGDALTQFLAPFIGGDIAASAIGEIIYNRKRGGKGEVYNIEAPLEQRAVDIANHVRKAIQPGFMSNAERTYKAIQGETTRTGRQYNLKDEGLGWIGFRFGTLNIPESLKYSGYGFKDRTAHSSKLLSYVAGSVADVSDKELRKAVVNMLDARESAFNDMGKLVSGAKKLGMKEGRIHEALSAAGVSSGDIGFLLAGRVPRWVMSKTFLKAASRGAMVSATTSAKRGEINAKIMKRKENIVKLVQDEYKKRRSGEK